MREGCVHIRHIRAFDKGSMCILGRAKGRPCKGDLWRQGKVCILGSGEGQSPGRVLKMRECVHIRERWGAVMQRCLWRQGTVCLFTSSEVMAMCVVEGLTLYDHDMPWRHSREMRILYFGKTYVYLHIWRRYGHHSRVKLDWDNNISSVETSLNLMKCLLWVKKLTSP